MPGVTVTKMHGTLNDFIVVDQRPQTIADFSLFAVRYCDRRGGIGADGVIVLLPSERADACMRVFNADGSEAEMCGNGARCAALLLCDRGMGTRIAFDTLAGTVVAQVLEDRQVRVNLGVPRFQPSPAHLERAEFVSIGNPHVVYFTKSPDEADLETLARAHPHANVHVAGVLDSEHMRVRHFERGVGYTHSCGTGAVACAAAAMRRRMVGNRVDVAVPGGHVLVEWDGEHEAFLTGPAVKVFEAVVQDADAIPV